jgi:hypothetical protein
MPFLVPLRDVWRAAVPTALFENYQRHFKKHGNEEHISGNLPYRILTSAE